MKNIYSAIIFVLTLAMILIPLCAGQVSSAKPPIMQSDDSFLVFDPEQNTVSTLTAKEYITGVLLAEMPLSYHDEALKAQAVASYTFACYKRNLRTSGATDTEYDLTTQPGTDQSYLSPVKAKEKFGENYEQYLAKASEIINSVAGRYLSYNDAPALTVYHAVSSGQTESAKDVWGEDYPYLTACKSRGDLMAEDYVSTVQFTDAEVEAALGDKISSDKDYVNWFSNASRTESGMVKSCTVSGNQINGVDIRQALKLKSSNFYTSFADSVFTFTVYGYGHGVGMSQYGANYMALAGNDYKQILEHYYPGCVLKNE